MKGEMQFTAISDLNHYTVTQTNPPSLMHKRLHQFNSLVYLTCDCRPIYSNL